VESKTKAGDFTIDLLDLNEAKSVKHRELTLHSLDLFESKLAEWRGLRAALQKEVKAGHVDQDAAQDDFLTIDANIAMCAESLRQLSGDE